MLDSIRVQSLFSMHGINRVKTVLSQVGKRKLQIPIDIPQPLNGV